MKSIDSLLQKIIFWLFAALLFFVPLVLWPFTSEVFEFNKIVLTYALTVLIVAVWLSRCIVERKFIFRRTILDWPLLIFLGSQIISTILSIDFYTSLFGYYSRFNGGLLSTICYLILYWAFVSNIDRKHSLFLIHTSLFSATLVAVYGVLEHFGIDKNLWVQDVQSRVFSSLGQPNWLAAWIVALIPITWAFGLEKFQSLNSKSFMYFFLSILFFWVLIFTKSRSGFLGFIIADLIFWFLYLLQNYKQYFKKLIILFGIWHLAFGIICLISGTQWTPSLNELINKSAKNVQVSAQGTALEAGGTESGTIRQIVWKGAIQIWLHYPIFGTGVETYAYSYYLFRPVEHNLTSEWDFIYNKAHNEFLNYLANTGIVGLLSYLIIIVVVVFQLIKELRFMIYESKDNIHTSYFILHTSLLAGFISLSASNFFGFSVVPTQLEFFLFPAFAIAISNQPLVISENKKKINSAQKIVIFIILLATCYLLLATFHYWKADILYAKGKAENSVGHPELAYQPLSEAIRLEPSQAIYYGELSVSYSTIAMAYWQEQNKEVSQKFVDLAANEIQKAISLSPANINLRRQMFGVYVRLSSVEESYLSQARSSLLETIKLAPTDAKLYFNLGIADANLGDMKAAETDFLKAIELKPNYSDARVEYAALLVHLKQNKEARNQLEYVLNKIDPNNSTAKQALENLK